MRRMLTSVIAITLTVALFAGRADRANAQQVWGAPWCGGQPQISSVMDHDLPNFSKNQIVRLYTGSDKWNCKDAKSITFNASDGHEGWDYTRATRRQGCGTGKRDGLAMDLIYAASDGTVFRSRWDEAAHDGGAAHYGLYLDIDHGGDGPMRSLYGHLAAVFVEEGKDVAQGQLIGALGTTGHSTGPHLHFHASKGDDATISSNVLDIYGWCRDWTSFNCPYPGFPDPHRGDGWSQRLIRPSQPGAKCPGGCGSVEIDDASPSVTFRCGAGVDCPHWYGSPTGFHGGHRYTFQNGRTKDYYVQYRCPECGPGTYLIEANVPLGATAHIARYEIARKVTIMDQHEEKVWHPLGIFSFTGVPMVELNDRTDRYDWGFDASSQYRIAADVIRFTRICTDVPPGVG